MNKILSKILKNWYIYLLTGAVTVIASCYYIDFANKPRNEETLYIFSATYTKNTIEFKNNLLERSPSYLREITIFNVYPDISNFSYYLANQGLNRADIFILPTSVLFDELLEKQFLKLDQNVLKQYFSATLDASEHGVLLHKKGSGNNGLLTFSTETSDEDYYVFYRKNSLHAVDYDTSFKLTKELLRDYE